MSFLSNLNRNAALAVSGIKDVALKLRYFVAHPSESGSVLGSQISAAIHGRVAPDTVLDRKKAAESHVNLGNLLALPIAVEAGGFSGVVGGVASGFGQGKVSDFAAAHPFATTGALAAIAVAPAATIAVGGSLIRSAGTVAAAEVSNGQQQRADGSSNGKPATPHRATPKPSRNPRKPKPKPRKRKAASRSKPRTRKAAKHPVKRKR